jgi:hypothetical protein
LHRGFVLCNCKSVERYQGLILGWQVPEVFDFENVSHVVARYDAAAVDFIVTLCWRGDNFGFCVQ